MVSKLGCLRIIEDCAVEIEGLAQDNGMDEPLRRAGIQARVQDMVVAIRVLKQEGEYHEGS